MPENIVLVGLPGSGKSRVGRALADATGLALIDLDHEFSAIHGIGPAQYIERYGEAAFREREATIAQTPRHASIIATGGGAVIDPISRWHLWHSGLVVWLDGDDELLHERIEKGAHRPLTTSIESLRARRAERTPFYAAADLRLDAALSCAEKVRLILEAAAHPMSAARALYRSEVRRDHPMGPRTASIEMGHRLDSAALAHLVSQHSTGDPVVVADRNVAAAQPHIVGAFTTSRRLLIDAGESNKRLAAADAMLEFAAEHRAERGDAWVAVGGGTTGDLVGCAAALYVRGAPLIQVPTTLLAMSDSAIGGKVGVDLAAAKNAAGAFWPPVAVVSDIAALSTLSRHQKLDGLAECIKSAIIGDPWLWDVIVARAERAIAGHDDAALYAIAERSAVLKLGVVERDPFELAERKNLNLGHTIGHALEIESGYRLTHGQGVMLGLRAVAHIAVSRGILAREISDSIDDLLRALGYATRRRFDAEAVTAALTRDKKVTAGTLTWILPTAIGHVTQARDVSSDEVAAALAHIQEA